MKRFALALSTAGALLLALPAWSQTAAPDPAALEAARKMFEVARMRNTMLAISQQLSAQLPLLTQQVTARMIEQNKELSPEKKKELLERAAKSAPVQGRSMQGLFEDPAVFDEMLAASVAVYARHFSVDELNQIGAFYASPAGAKLLSEGPKMMPEMMGAIQTLMLPRLTKMAEAAAREAMK
ncbi:DUF2059 domain-containing protein [Massilia sp. TS11]|uniref:DUF2059 domain-containing protein n=1 Tax=Massilia sp. TS11 TaxID=2908003 RepID=UPI001EDC47C2|nr:DUF2059 domain-containing protein [Massilia sp. TS11]MCG2585592.1 DUF2059 domain-containing protein [Massilia sp. TS11]